MSNSAPIGIFDSGVGGLSVWKPLVQLLPHESVYYFADSANAPYGLKSIQEILELAHSISQDLSNQGVKLIIVACNTATGIAINSLRNAFSLPFVGMEPAIKPAAEQSVSRKIGVLATAQTFEADHFNRTRDLFAQDVDVIIKIGVGLVELVESGQTDSVKTEKLLSSYLRPMIDEGIDQLVLGCTHYPFLIPVIRRIIPGHIAIHDPGPAVARQVKVVLESNKLLNEDKSSPEYRFNSSGDDQNLKTMAEGLMNN